jgi:hypothetical protein
MAKTRLTLGWTLPLCFYSSSCVPLPLRADSFSPFSSLGQFPLSYDGSFTPLFMRKSVGEEEEEQTEGTLTRAPTSSCWAELTLCSPPKT